MMLPVPHIDHEDDLIFLRHFLEIPLTDDGCDSRFRLVLRFLNGDRSLDHDALLAFRCT